VSKINPAYIDHLKFSLSSSSSVGIVGGKPNKSLYFFAYQDDFVFYLDPHFVHNTVKPIDNRGQIHDSYKVKFPSKIKFFDLDPSLALGFFLRTRADFEAFCHAHHTFAVQCQGDPTCEPIFTIQDTAPDYLKG
jgi:cysteine protease ATG4